jgi:hypothetical protein
VGKEGKEKKKKKKKKRKRGRGKSREVVKGEGLRLKK